MRDRELYAKILGIERPWKVVEVDLDIREGRVEVHLEHRGGTLHCPECGRAAPGYDVRERRWRHLDTCQYQTILVAKVPRVTCAEHGVLQTRVPWAEPGSRFTALFEALVIDWLQETSASGVARQLGLTWDQVDGVMQRAVRRGLARREARLPEHIGVDETSFQKRHEYVTIVHDAQTGAVVHVGDERKKEVLADFYAQFSKEDRARVQSVAMDMWLPYIQATKDAIPGAENKIAFDKFHIAKHLGDAVDKVRRQEHRELRRQGDESLTKTKYLWLTHPANIRDDHWAAFKALRTSNLRTARAWAIKETAMQLWHYTSRTWAEKGWIRWYGWAFRCRLAPMKEVGRMIKSHLWGIINAVVTNTTNARAESLNSVVQWMKYTARGYRNRERFRVAIYFHIGGLDLYPTGVVRT
ncbi:MAG: ISL3 family transposase [Polyangia bacterium]